MSLSASTFVNLGDVFKVSSGGTPSRKITEYFNGDIPWVKTGDLKGTYVDKPDENISQLGLDNSSAKLFPSKTVLLAMYGATIGACSILPFEAATNQACAAILPNKNYNEKYLYYYLVSIKQHLIGQGVGGAQPNISASLIKKIKIPNTTLAEQKKIVAILDSAHSLKSKDREIVDHYNKLSQSLFVNMFGDPVTNSKNWKITPFERSIINIIGGKSVSGTERPLKANELAVIKISAVTSGYFKENEYKVVEEKNIPDTLVKPNKGDLLFSRANTRELVGAVCVVDQDYDSLFLPDKIWKIVPKVGVVNQAYLKFLLSHEGFRENLRKVATGSSGSMLNISKAKLNALMIPVPQFDLQTQFEARLANIEEQKKIAQQSMKKSEELFNSLLQQAFKGELTQTESAN